MRNRADVRRRLGTALLVFGSVACADALGPERDELAAARARWALTGADDYRFDLQRSCFCASDQQVMLSRREPGML